MSSSLTLDGSKSGSIALYLFLAFLFSWVVLGLTAMAANGTIFLPLSATVLVTIATLGPFIAATSATAMESDCHFIDLPTYAQTPEVTVKILSIRVHTKDAFYEANSALDDLYWNCFTPACFAPCYGFDLSNHQSKCGCARLPFTGSFSGCSWSPDASILHR
jgi:hypothetical protein